MASMIGATVLATVVEAGVSAVLDRPALFWATLVGWFQVMVGWINLTYLLCGLGGTGLLLLGVAIGRNDPKKVGKAVPLPSADAEPGGGSPDPRVDAPPVDPHPTWVDEDKALALLRGHLLVTSIAKGMHEAGEAGLVGATHQVAEMALEEFAMEFPSSTKMLANRYGDIVTEYAQADLVSWADRSFASVTSSNPEPGEPDA